MTAIRFPDRIRLHGGRNTHAAGAVAGFPDGITACGYPVGSADDRKADDAPVTCRACQKELDR